MSFGIKCLCEVAIKPPKVVYKCLHRPAELPRCGKPPADRKNRKLPLPALRGDPPVRKTSLYRTALCGKAMFSAHPKAESEPRSFHTFPSAGPPLLQRSPREPASELDRFDVIAKVLPDTSPEAAKAMLRGLLAERFQLSVHRDIKAVQAFALELDKGKSKFKPGDTSAAAGCQSSIQRTQPGVAPYTVAICRNVTMDGFALALRGLASADITGPVANLTGLKGSWDIDVTWTDRRWLTSAPSDITIVRAVREQLGLVLGLKPVRMPVLVVDHANQKPTPNPPGTTTLLPPPEFEVASIKPSAPGARPGGGGFLPGGRVEFRATPLALLILNAWDLNLLPDEIPGAPKWLTPFEPSFDLFAKAPASVIANGSQLYQGDYQMMLRALLVDRFKMVSHYEDRPTNTYALVAEKPKLRKADPSNRPGCKTQRSWNTRVSESAPVLLEAVCRNITMTQFAQQLQSIAPLYFHYPVSDDTAIMGSWDLPLPLVGFLRISWGAAEEVSGAQNRPRSLIR